MNTSNESQLTCKQKLLSTLENSNLTIKTSGTEEAIEIMNRISDFLEIPLNPIRYANWCRFPIISHYTSTIFVVLSCVESQSQKHLDFCFGVNSSERSLEAHYTANEIENIITANEEQNNTESLSMEILREFSTTYGIELSITPEGWLVVDGTNEAVLTDIELVRYMTAYESIKDIMLKFKR